MKKFFLVLVIQFISYVPFMQVRAAEQPTVDFSDLLVKITSAVALEEFGENQLKPSSSLSFTEQASQLAFQPLSTTPVQSYFPLNNNDIRRYSGTVHGTTYSTTMRYSSVNYNGRSCFREDDSIDGSIAYYGYNAGEVQMYGVMVDNVSYPFQSPLTFLNDTILTNGGSLQSSTTFVVQGMTITLNVTVNSSPTGSVTTSLGEVTDCRSIAMDFSYIIPGESGTLDLREVWILAPGVGKVQIAMMDQNMNNLGWMTIIDGTVGGQNVSDIINPNPPRVDSLPFMMLLLSE
ncbi:MAG: hypothetical protein U9R57_15315 [Thermodesulfobacteriota bacterium]|nr:hypothetical protein [Thermodesulfobacteriota bacterium]